MFNMLLMIPKMTAPNMVPQTDPLPPVIGVPPIMTAAMASSSKAIPVLEVLTALNLDDRSTAETATKKPVMA